jgi:hypothetical protein
MRVSHDHENNCPPKIENGLWWKVPVVIACVPVYAFLKAVGYKEPGYINRLRREGKDV